MSAIRAVIIGLALFALTGPAVVRRIRRGRFYQRGPHGLVERRKEPVRFWTGVVAVTILAGVGLALCLWGVIRLLAGGR